MKVSIEKRKTNKGVSTIRLVYYFGYSKTDEGKIVHNREREKLDLFIYDNPKNKTEKQHNKDALTIAETIKARRIIEYQNGKFNFKTISSKPKSFNSFFQAVLNDKQRSISKSAYLVWDSTYKHLVNFKSRDLTMADINNDFVSGFKFYLKSKAINKHGGNLSRNTASSYFNKFRSVVLDAIKKGLISDQSIDGITGIKPENNKREHLEESELIKLSETPCKNDLLKRAFLFSCLTGMRWSDIQKLLWDEIQHTDNGYRIIFNQKKTNGLQYLDLPDEAYSLLSHHHQTTVFHGLKYTSYNNTELLKWCVEAGITKHITFHSGRHTFAVYQLSKGTDIYTVSKLLGHSDLKTTQIYADIIDSKKREAMLGVPAIKL